MFYLIAGCLCFAAAFSSNSARAQTEENDAVPATTNDRTQAARDSLYTAISPVLKQTDGHLTADVRSAYLAWASNTVSTELARHGKTIPDDCLAEVGADPTLRDAAYLAVFPPDPSILQNYAHWRATLGPEFLQKYHSLVIAFAVAKRMNSVETNEDMDTIPMTLAGRKANYDRDPRGNYEPGFWVDQSLKSPKTPKDKAFVSAIAEFLKTNQVAALDLYQSSALQAQLIAFLKERQTSSDLVKEVRQSEQFGERLKFAMVLLGQRPRSREAKPDTATWIRHVASTYEATPSSVPDGLSWPLFPIAQAPWPLLMPLVHPVPLGETKYIWEMFQGQHGPDRFHTYGPFRDGKDAMPYELHPSPWYWDAWPDEIFHGGECVPISKATVDLYSSLGRPAVWAGQPGHANLISFNYTKGAWGADVEQAFAGGPDVTYAQWFFEDDPRTAIRFRQLYHWAGAEYHLGLAEGMNPGLPSYLNTRMAAAIYKTLPDADQKTIGANLLRDALDANPFNPDLWYRLALQTPDGTHGMAFIQNMMKRATDDSSYWQTTEECAAQLCIMDRPVPQTEAELHEICVFLQSVPGIKFEDMEAYATKYYQDQADKKDPLAELRMGERYQDGIGVPRDEVMARHYYSSSAFHGNLEALRELDLLNATVPTNGISVTASSQYGTDQAVGHLVDGSGLWRGLHDNNGSAQTMWHSISHPEPRPPAPGLKPSPAWVRFDFTEPQYLASIRIWNHNQSGLTDRGFRKTEIYGSADGSTWFHLTSPEVIELPRASGNPGQAGVTIATTATSQAVRSVIIAAEPVEGNFGSDDIYGLSAVRFLMDPKVAALKFPRNF